MVALDSVRPSVLRLSIYATYYIVSIVKLDLSNLCISSKILCPHDLQHPEPPENYYLSSSEEPAQLD